jgi:F-type H+-transporting ATPase subunit b
VKGFYHYIFKACIIATILWCLPGSVAAAETSADWRPTYDLVLRYINFLILVFLIFKFARKPLVNFFKDKSQDVKIEIQKIEEAKEKIEEQVKAMLEAREKSREKFERIKARIVSQGETRKKHIIEDAKQESKLLLENTHLKVDYMILRAKQTLQSEMIDMAIDMAMEKLPQEITDQDSQRFSNQFLENTESIISSSPSK